MKGFKTLFDAMRANPLASVMFVVLVVVVLGGIVWKGLGMLFGLVRKVPGVGEKVANAAEGAVEKVAKATGSA